MGRRLSSMLRVGLAAAFVLAVLAVPAAAQAATAKATFYDTPPSGWQAKDPGTLLKYTEVTRTWPSLQDLTAYRIMYVSLGATDGFSHGGKVFETGMVYIPKATAPAAGWPVLAWGHGTSGVGDSAAPSKYPWLYPEPKSSPWPEYANFVAEAAGLGCIVTCPDYEGMGTPGLATYLNIDSESHSMIDAVRAARDLATQLSVPASTAWAAAGHSQGGGAAIGAAQIAATYAPELDMRGTVAFAPAGAKWSSKFLEKNMTGPDWYPYMGYMAWGMKAIDTQHQFKLRDLVGSWLRPYVSKAPQLYFDGWWYTLLEAHWAGGVFPKGYPLQPTLRQVFTKGWQKNPVVRRFFADWEVGQTKATGPILVVQGTSDVLYKSLPLLRTQLSGAGDQTTYTILKGRDHDQAVVYGWPSAKAFLQQNLIHVF